MYLRRENLEAYLKSLYGEKLELVSMRKMGETIPTTEDVKGFGYGSPLLVEYKIGNKPGSAVISAIRMQHGFGHDHFSDRARILLWQNSTFAKLPKHVASLDAGYFGANGRLVSVGDAHEFFLLMPKVEGKEYFLDLERIKENGATDLDYDRTKALSNYLAEIHKVKYDCPPLYLRKIRETLGDGECIFGILDDYPENPGFLDPDELREIEKICVNWRWMLKSKTGRLCQVHGDFHPWNIMFREGTDFTVLDRSRGEWGEAADDITSIAMNYIFYSVQKSLRLTGDLKDLFELFFENYLEKSGDGELLEVIAPFIAFRATVVASPTWYPLLSDDVRRKLFNFLENVMASKKFNYRDANGYLA